MLPAIVRDVLMAEFPSDFFPVTPEPGRHGYKMRTTKSDRSIKRSLQRSSVADDALNSLRAFKFAAHATTKFAGRWALAPRTSARPMGVHTNTPSSLAPSPPHSPPNNECFGARSPPPHTHLVVGSGPHSGFHEPTTLTSHPLLALSAPVA